MEEKRTGTPPPAASSAEAPVAEGPSSSRRRGHKRKASATGSGNTSTHSASSSKRQAREKPPVVPVQPIHNGPLTRARQQPNNSAAAAAAPLPSGVESELQEVAPKAAREGEMAKADELHEVAKEDWQALEAKFEAEYEVIRTRDSNVHVVPNHAGWFSWTKTHPLEEKTLPSFFNGKSGSRTPEIYMEIRNWIMKKFHANPNEQIELKDLSDISVGELEARQEVMEFLDYWGLINYHPFPKTDLTSVSITADAHKAAIPDSLMECLFRYESEQSSVPSVRRKSVAVPSMPSGLFPESTLIEELFKSEGPEVEYHCNSCSADCSRKRYHCQKQADFDLCTECFNNGKFGSDMSPSDFIIMEPADAGGASGGNWTDQETLLLLEALELFKENWNEIAEHVATKTKAQCILHFVQMPIEDTFLDSCDDIDSKVNSDAVSISNDSSAPKDVPETTESKEKENDNQPSSSPMESLKPEEVNGSTVKEVSKNFAMKALAEAFESVGSLPSPGERLSFAEAGNPVMTLVAFLVRLLEPNIATASARSSLKSISGNSSADHLALRNCFCLEDPPDEKKSAHAERTAGEMVEQETPNTEEQNAEKQENCSPVIDGVHRTNDDNNSNNDYVMEEERPLASPNCATLEEPASAKESDETAHKESDSKHVNKPDNPDLAKDLVPSTEDKSDDLTMEVEVPPGFEKQPDYAASFGEPSKSAESPKDMDMMPEMKTKDHLEQTTSHSVSESEANIGVTQETNKEANGVINDEKCASDTKHNHTVHKIKSAAVTALSAAAVKAKLLANQEEQQIHRLVTLLIEKQLHKLETKLAFFNDMENMVMRVREQLEKSKQRLFHERAQIIASRFGISASRPMPQSLPINRVAMGFANSAPRPIIGSSVRPPNQGHLSSVGTK